MPNGAKPSRETAQGSRSEFPCPTKANVTFSCGMKAISYIRSLRRQPLRGAPWFRSFASPHLAKLRLRTPFAQRYTPSKKRSAFSLRMTRRGAVEVLRNEACRMEQNQAVKRRRDLVTSFRVLPKQMLHFPVERKRYPTLDPFVAALLGFARLLRRTSRNFDGTCLQACSEMTHGDVFQISDKIRE